MTRRSPPAGSERAAVCTAATRAASASTNEGVIAFRSSILVARDSWSNSRILTAYSIAGPPPPSTGASTLPVIGDDVEIEIGRERAC